MGSRGRSLATVLVAAALAACLLAAPVAGAAPREFYGVNSAEMPSSADLNRMGAGGMGTVRVNLVWGAVQSGRSAEYDWGVYDSVVGNAAENGIRVLPTIYSSPRWVALSHEHPPPTSALGLWRAFARAAAGRYGNGGDFWAENPDLPQIPVTDWQIWNESSSPTFWKPKPNAKRYVRLLRKARAGIEAADPRARIMLAGLFPTPGTDLGVSIDRYLPQIYRAGGRRLFDSVALHPYNIRPRGTLRDLKRVRAIMTRFKDRRKPLWATEVGWASGGPPYFFTVSRELQAEHLRRTYNLLARNRKRLKLRGVVWFSLRDYGERDDWFENTGLLTFDGSPKPAWHAFVRLTGGTP
jgi:hypothetical protein